MIYVGILWFVCSIPVVTMGASTTALFEVLMQMEKDREGYIGASFLRAFQKNFKHATLVWMPILFAGIVFLMNEIYYGLLGGGKFTVQSIVFGIFLLLTLALTGFIFPVLAKFENTVADTFRFTILLMIRNPGWVIINLLLQMLTLFVCYFFVYMPTLFIMGILGYLQAAIFNYMFDRLILRGEIMEKKDRQEGRTI